MLTVRLTGPASHVYKYPGYKKPATYRLTTLYKGLVIHGLERLMYKHDDEVRAEISQCDSRPRH